MKTQIDLDDALLDPASAFKSPEEVRDHAELTTAQKIEILRRWEYEESEIAVAEEEGMIDGAAPRLHRVLMVLEELTDGIDTKHTPPTKFDGV